VKAEEKGKNVGPMSLSEMLRQQSEKVVSPRTKVKQEMQAKFILDNLKAAAANPEPVVPDPVHITSHSNFYQPFNLSHFDNEFSSQSLFNQDDIPDRAFKTSEKIMSTITLKNDIDAEVNPFVVQNNDGSTPPIPFIFQVKDER
jgi:hypothetical protein